LFTDLQSICNEHRISRPAIELYIASGGLEAVVRGSSLAKYFTGIWGCCFHEVDGRVGRIRNAISLTENTKYIYAINKGIENEVRRGRVAEMRRRSDAGLGDSAEDRTLADRCLMGFNAGPPMTPGSYNNNLQIVQGPGVVVVINEMVHNARIIPTDGRPHTPFPQWTGDSRGRWEGETLVVETIKYNSRSATRARTSGTGAPWCRW
jgi:hypothetical protein